VEDDRCSICRKIRTMRERLAYGSRCEDCWSHVDLGEDFWSAAACYSQTKGMNQGEVRGYTTFKLKLKR
jgi:hypothetical protein